MSNHASDRVEQILDLIAQEQTAEALAVLQEAEASQKEAEADELEFCRKLLNGVVHMRSDRFDSGIRDALAALANLEQHYRRKEQHFHDRLSAVARTTAVFSGLERARQTELTAKNNTLEQQPAGAEALRDTLTGSLNHQGLAFASQALFVPEQQLAVVIADIDTFKSINDKYGHEAGDKVLQAIARIFNQSLRDADLVARLGSDEFMLIVKGVGKEAAWGTCERLRQAVDKHGWGTIAPNLHVTISLGLAVRMHDEELDILAAKANAVMDEAKTEGRNRVAARE
ncbi:MAG: GGDEF domain-containing protein [Chloroflexota bacterium]